MTLGELEFGDLFHFAFEGPETVWCVMGNDTKTPDNHTHICQVKNQTDEGLVFHAGRQVYNSNDLEVVKLKATVTFEPVQ